MYMNDGNGIYVNLYYIVEAAVSRVSELMRFLRRKVKTEDLIDLPSAEEWMNRLYDEWPIHGRTLSTGRTLKKNAGEISLTILAEIFAWYHDGVDSLTIYTQDTDGDFLKSTNKKSFRQVHAEDIAKYEEALHILKQHSPDGKFPTMKDLRTEKEQLTIQKDAQYDTYHYFRDYHKELQTVCANVDSILETEREAQHEQQQSRKNEHFL